jgi:hypothetical protein
LQISGGVWCLTQDPTHKACAGTADAPTLGRWSHLVGVLDAPRGLLRLFVDGVQKAEITAATPMTSTGSFAVGRGQASGSAAEWFAGQVDEVRVWQRVVYGEHVRAIANDYEVIATQLAYWELDGDTSDWSDFGAGIPTHQGTLSATNATWTTGGAPGSSQAVSLTGSPGAVTYTGPVMRTNQSFTISAWVKINDTANYYTFVSQAGSVGCAFYLQYAQNYNRWRFVVPFNDAIPPSGYWNAISNAAPAVNTWTHLVAVYDAGAKTMALWVGTTGGLVKQTTVATGVRIWSSAGQWRLGTCAVNPNFAKGAIDQVKVYAGALADSDVVNL